MRTRIGIIGSSVVALLACTGSDRSGGRVEREPPPPTLTVELRPGAEIGTVWATAEAVPTPVVQFPALIRADSNHMSLVASPLSGAIVRIRPDGHARGHEVLVVVRQGSRGVGREVPILVEQDGSWHPRRQVGQLVYEGDTLGVVEAHGYWLAVGSVSAVEYSSIHPGDPASVAVPPDRHDSRPAKVEWVRPPWTESPVSADIAVEFRAPETSHANEWGPVTVAVMAGHGDTVAAVPASAVAQLPSGPVVFVPVGTGRYEVHWISTGPLEHGLIVVRQGLSSGTSVVARGLGALVDAARDSLTARDTKGRRS